jgi:hypothetical protein
MKGQALLSDVGNDGRSIDTPRFFRVILAGIHTQVLILHGVILIMSIYLAASFYTGSPAKQNQAAWRCMTQLSTAQHIISLSVSPHTHTLGRAATSASMVGVARYHEDFFPSRSFSGFSGRQTPLVFFPFQVFGFWFFPISKLGLSCFFESNGRARMEFNHTLVPYRSQARNERIPFFPTYST